MTNMTPLHTVRGLIFAWTASMGRRFENLTKFGLKYHLIFSPCLGARCWFLKYILLRSFISGSGIRIYSNYFNIASVSRWWISYQLSELFQCYTCQMLLFVPWCPYQKWLLSVCNCWDQCIVVVNISHLCVRYRKTDIQAHKPTPLSLHTVKRKYFNDQIQGSGCLQENIDGEPRLTQHTGVSSQAMAWPCWKTHPH